MLPKKNRFSFKTKLPKQTFSSPSFSIRFGENEEGLKLAVVVSKKVATKAVDRNKIKRRIVEFIEKNLDKATSLTLIFYVKKDVDLETLSEEVKQALQKIHESN
jgi:ribonuclease P protein component